MLVSPKPEILIKDACIFFDLIDLGLLSGFYHLQLVVVTTQPVLDEIINEAHLAEVMAYYKSGQLQLDQFGLFENITLITDANPGLSFADASVLEAAIRRNATVLSSDKGLRNESDRRGISVCGMLWVLEELHIQKIIERSILLEKLEAYRTINPRAPKTEIDNLIKKYNS